AKKQHLSLIIIDNLQLLKGAGNVISKQDEQSLFSLLQNLIATLGIPIILLSQTPSREGSGLDEPKCFRRESSVVERNADVLAFLHRDGYYDRTDPSKERQAVLILTKQRLGLPNEIQLEFNRDFLRFDILEI
ncbi:MAG: DnaB-like helicase C-terminal domain-containing protein, partial [Elusimicrobiota bacterium]